MALAVAAARSATPAPPAAPTTNPTEFPPTIRSYIPGSSTHFIAGPTYQSSRVPIVNSTRRDSPALSEMR